MNKNSNQQLKLAQKALINFKSKQAKGEKIIQNFTKVVQNYAKTPQYQERLRRRRNPNCVERFIDGAWRLVCDIKDEIFSEGGTRRKSKTHKRRKTHKIRKSSS